MYSKAAGGGLKCIEQAPVNPQKIKSESLKAISVWEIFRCKKEKNHLVISTHEIPKLNTHIPATIFPQNKKSFQSEHFSAQTEEVPQYMCSPYYCPTPELQFKLKCSPHCKGLDSSGKSVQHLNMVLLQKKAS